jgi:hypothetical protein
MGKKEKLSETQRKKKRERRGTDKKEIEKEKYAKFGAQQPNNTSPLYKTVFNVYIVSDNSCFTHVTWLVSTIWPIPFNSLILANIKLVIPLMTLVSFKNIYVILSIKTRVELAGCDKRPILQYRKNSQRFCCARQNVGTNSLTYFHDTPRRHLHIQIVPFFKGGRIA